MHPFLRTPELTRRESTNSDSVIKAKCGAICKCKANSKVEREKGESSDYPPIPQSPSTASITLLSLPRLPSKNIPKPQRLIPSPSNHYSPIRAHGQIQHSVGVARETRDLSHGGILPDHNLVLRIPVGGDDLVGILGPRKVADLGARVNLVDCSATEGVVEDYSSICSSAA